MNDEQTIIMPPELAAKMTKRDKARAVWKAERARWLARHAQYHDELMRAKAAWKASGADWRAWTKIKRRLKYDHRGREVVAVGEDIMLRQGRTVATYQDGLDAIRLGAIETTRRLAGRAGCR